MSIKDRIVELAYELKDRFTGKHRRVTSSIKEVERATGKSASKIKKYALVISSSFQSLLDLGKRAFLPLTATIGGLLGSVINIGSSFESLKVSLETVTGSAEAAEQAFQLITDFAKETPYSIEEITQAFIKLKALGLDPSEEALRSYGNTASAMGKTLDQFVEAVADAAVGEFERLKEFGIKARSEGENVSLTFQGVTQTVGKNATEIEAYLRNIGNVQFAGGMEKQMDTVGGAFSNLKDNISALANKLYESGIGKAIQTILGRASEAIKGLSGRADELSSDIISATRFVTVGVVKGVDAIKLAWGGLVISVKLGGAAIATVLEAITTYMGNFTVLRFTETGAELRKFADDMKAIRYGLGGSIGKDFFNMQQLAEGIIAGKNTRDIEQAFNQMLEDVNPKIKTIDMTDALKRAKEAMKELEQEKLNIKVNMVLDTPELREELRQQILKVFNSMAEKSGSKE